MGKERKPSVILLDPEDEVSIKGLADIITESLNEECEHEMESFEEYSLKVRAHLHADPNHFRARFLKGYQVLLEELVKH